MPGDTLAGREGLGDETWPPHPGSIVTLEAIQQALAGPLPGQAGQQKMAPAPLPGDIDRWGPLAGCREAGVLVLLYPQQAELYLILTRRVDYPGVHGGQISLPGGRREGTESLSATALREAQEEIGLCPNSVELMGSLSVLYTPVSNFCIYPFVAFSPVRPNFRPNPAEVAALIETPLSLLLNPTTRREEMWYFEQGRRRVPFFDILGHKVWGATAMILSEFLMVVGNK
jgi:8-oxo-dGTP pyrophosphatase MutT (NUDIX family)